MLSQLKQFNALVIGSSGSIGQAFVEHLKNMPNCSNVIGLSRQSAPSIDYANPSSIQEAADALSHEGRFHLIIVATGILHTDAWSPEKKLLDLNEDQFMQTMQLNALGPGMCLQSFAPLLDPEFGVMACLSAKVGSIEDNRLGGWYSYRASKAALNMLIKTASIEQKRTRPNNCLLALHPGTVASALSRPFKGDQIGRTPRDATSDMLQVLLNVTSNDTGKFLSYQGEEIPW
jgi:NAD(P)-dependent dehydrogenase (short-subunit alcohol dehydrogenase family)